MKSLALITFISLSLLMISSGTYAKEVDQSSLSKELIEYLYKVEVKNIKPEVYRLVAKQDLSTYTNVLASHFLFKSKNYAKAKEFLYISDLEAPNQAYTKFLLFFAFNRGAEYDRAVKFAKEFIQLAKQPTDNKRLLYTYTQMSDLSYTLGDYQESVNYAHRSLELSKLLRNKKQEVNAYFSLSEAYYQSNKLAESETHALKTQNLAKELGLTRYQAHANKVLGNIKLNQKLFTESKAFYEFAIKEYQSIGDDHGLANCYFNLAFLAKKTGGLGEAINYYQQASFYYMQSGSPGGSGMSKAYLTKLYNDTGDYSKALLQAEESRDLLTRTGKLFRLAQLDSFEGDTYKALNDKNKAMTLYNNALQYFQKTGNRAQEKVVQKKISKLSSE